MRFRYINLKTVLLCLTLLSSWASSWANRESAQVFAYAKDGVVQIRVIHQGTGEKISIGSGFTAFSANRIISNYHVVSEYIAKPQQYRLQYVTSSGDTGDLKLLDFDVVHDLSLLQASVDIYPPFELAETPPNGAQLYSMGNPHDLGLTLAAGTSNGILPHSDDGRILFSGNLNPGMSGGPTFNAQNQVVGINVATSGNDLSFIIPAHYLKQFAQTTKPKHDKNLSTANQQIAQQVYAYQKKSWAGLLQQQKWTATQLDKYQAPGAISKIIRCWDNSKAAKPDDHYRELSSSCENENDIYLSHEIRVNRIAYEYIWLKSIDLSSNQFYSLYQKNFNGTANLAYRGAKKDGVSNFACGTHFVNIAQQTFKVSLCRRDYKKFKGLSDLTMMAAKVGEKDAGFLIKLSLIGTDYQLALTFMKCFLENITWRS